jgi:colicin import membrane protein
VILVKRAIAIIVSLLFVLSVAGLTFAAEKAMEKKEAPMKEEKAMEKKAPAKVKMVTGEVTAVDMKANTLTVKGKKAEMTVTCEDKTKVMMGKEKKACADVKVGDKVTTKYSEAEGKNMAKSVSIHEAKPAAEEKAAAKKKAAEDKAAAEKKAAEDAAAAKKKATEKK